VGEDDLVRGMVKLYTLTLPIFRHLLASIQTTSPSFRFRLPPLLPLSLQPKPTPSLPTEMLRHIIHFLPVDDPSFPTLCLVDSTFREIASPMLYDDRLPVVA
jgi:hypothetical protein